MSDGIEIGTAHRRARVTLPEEGLFHMIADHELDMIADGTSPHKELTLACAGMAAGLVLPALSGILSFSGTGRISWIDLAGLCLFFALLGVTIVCAFTWWKSRKIVAAMKARIRSRHDRPLGTIPDLDYR